MPVVWKLSTSQQHLTEDNSGDTAALLESHQLLCIECLHDHDFYFESEKGRKFMEMVHPQFEATQVGLSAENRTFKETCDVWRSLAEIDPNCRYEVKSLSSDVSVGIGKAKVYIEIMCHGFYPDNPAMRQRSFACNDYVRDKESGRWQWRRFTAMLANGMLTQDGF